MMGWFTLGAYCKGNKNKSSIQTPQSQGAYQIRRGEKHLNIYIYLKKNLIK